mmetsp:Transcript_2475/g.5409  ORF Transcript_2475/g.5409 Transcript_2475/m.5409 type:complete len:411 (+) Transcript_2475:1150-2382(+)
MLTKLSSLVLSHNQLTGIVPSHLGLMSNLWGALDLSNNTLSGPIPSNIGMLSFLEFLDLSKNALTGTLPTELAMLTSLTYLSLSHNELTGMIPTELALLTNVGELGLMEENQLTPNNNTCTIDVTIDGCLDFSLLSNNNCEDVPIVISFVYNGGDCSQSDNLKNRSAFECVDSSTSPPPIQIGTVSYIVATDIAGDIYFEGFVAVGDSYTLNEDRMLDELSEDINITIYDPKDSSDPNSIVDGANILQTVLVDFSCSQPLFLADRFGANAVIEWIEPDGRTVTVANPEDFAPQLAEVTVFIVATDDVPVRLLALVFISNTEELNGGQINKTDEVYGTVLTGNVLELNPIQYTVDVSKRVRYTFFATIVAETIDGSSECNGFDFHECITGSNIVPFFPTVAPTFIPTVTPT